MRGRVNWVPKALQNIDFNALKKRNAVYFQKLWSRLHNRSRTSADQGTTAFLFSAKVALPCGSMEGDCGKWIV